MFRELFERALTQGFQFLRPHLFKNEPLWLKFFLGRYKGFVGRPDTLEFMKSFRDDHDLDPRTDCIKARVDLVWGSHDTMVPTRWSRTWQARLENSDLHLIRGAGHTFHLEDPGQTAKVLRKVLTGPRRS
jgi:pimeloyl-ACP methyl ester carboxylesterase